jgi:ubiquinone/menaquinone biosynthesis C-methylase UbiE
MTTILQKGYKGKGMDGFIARFYDKTARLHIMEQYKIWALSLKKLIPNDAHLLEVAPGPGYLSIELAKCGISRITGVDISESFVEIAVQNAKKAGVQIDFKQGDASALPFGDGEFSHVICTSAFKNFSAPLDALKEMYRVLASDGIAWLCDMRHDVSDVEIDRYVQDMMKLKGLNSLFTKITFKTMLRKWAYTKDSILDLISKTPFKVISFEQNAMEFYVVMKKQPKPIQGDFSRAS